jgi:hypothetical protein
MWREPDTSAILPLPTSRQISGLLIWRSSPPTSLSEPPRRARVEQAIPTPSVTRRAQPRLDRRIDSLDGCDAVGQDDDRTARM